VVSETDFQQYFRLHYKHNLRLCLQSIDSLALALLDLSFKNCEKILLISEGHNKNSSRSIHDGYCILVFQKKLASKCQYLQDFSLKLNALGNQVVWLSSAMCISNCAFGKMQVHSAQK